MTSNRPDLKLVRVLQALFIAQARDVVARVTLDGQPDLSRWVPVLAQAVRPYYLQLYRQGMLGSARRIDKLRRGITHGDERAQEATRRQAQVESAAVRQAAQAAGGSRLPEPVATWHPALRPGMGVKEHRPPAAGHGLRLFGGGGAGDQGDTVGKQGVDFSRHYHHTPQLRRFYRKALGYDFNLFGSRVDEAVDAAVFDFCRATNATATAKLDNALAQLRGEMRTGLRAGEAHTALTRRVLGIFADPLRAWRIAVTESSRAQHLGGLLAARDSGVVGGKRWLASSDACPSCLKLADREVGLEEPFVVLPGGGPYAVVMTPPLHPGCFCTWTEVLL